MTAFAGRCLAAATALWLACGCATTATIARRDGASSVDGDILGRDDRNLYVASDGTADPLAVAHDDIAEIDHPGGGQVIAGMLLIAASIPLLAIGGAAAAEDPSEGHTNWELKPRPEVPLGAGFTLLAAGVGSTIWGISLKSGSRKRAARAFAPRPGDTAPPTARRDAAGVWHVGR